jgi:anti-sigma-K factor RskA
MNVETHGLAGAYAVDALDDAERVAFETHLATCSECQAEVESLRAAASELSALSEATPPAAVRESVLASIRSVRPLPPLTGAAEGPPDAEVVPITRRSWRRPAAWLVAAAAAIAVVVGGIAWSPWSDDAPPPTVAERVLDAGDATAVEKQVGDATATVVISRSVGRAVIITDDMPEAPSDKDYQLWLQQPDGTMESAGLMPHTAAAHSEVVLEGNAAGAVGVGITEEPRGGSAQPTSDPIALFEFSA